MEWLYTLGGVIAGIIAMFPIIRKYLEKLAKIVKSVADLISGFILVESIQEQFLRKVAEVLEHPEKIAEYRETLKTLVDTKKEEFEKLKQAWQQLMETI